MDFVSYVVMVLVMANTYAPTIDKIFKAASGSLYLIFLACLLLTLRASLGFGLTTLPCALAAFAYIEAIIVPVTANSSNVSKVTKSMLTVSV